MKSKPTQIGIPAYSDLADPYGELPTDPLPDPDSIPTERPSLAEMAELLSQSAAVPKFEYDNERRTWMLSDSFTATQADKWGNTYIVPCRRGCPVNISLIIEPRAIRAECVRMALEEDRTIASVLMNGARFPEQLGRLNDEWASNITRVFYEADMS